MCGGDLYFHHLPGHLPSCWEKPNPNVSCLDGLAEDQASIRYPDSQFKENFSGQESGTPKTFSGMLNTPKLCWDPFVWVLISPLLLCHLSVFILSVAVQRRGCLSPSGQRQQIWGKPHTSSGLPQFILLAFGPPYTSLPFPVAGSVKWVRKGKALQSHPTRATCCPGWAWSGD